MLFYFMMVIRYIRIKQRCCQVKIDKLTKKIQVKLSSKHTSKEHSNNLWLAFKQIYLQMLEIHKEIRGQNSFWSPFITIYFVVYQVQACYLTYAVIFVSIEEASTKFIFGYCAVEFMLLLFYVTLECSRIVNMNMRMHGDCLKMALKFTENSRKNYGDNVSRFVAELLLLDNMAANRKKITQICFKWTNDYRVNSQMFQLVRKVINF